MTDEQFNDISNISLHLQLAMEAGNIAWWEMELPTGKVIFNENKTKMLGYAAKGFTKYQDFTNLVHPDDYETIMKAMRDHLEGKKDVYETEYRIKTSTGEYKWFYDRGRVVERKEHGYIKVIGIVQDITDLKKTISELELKSKELEEMNKYMIGRELKMVELKNEIELLKKKPV